MQQHYAPPPPPSDPVSYTHTRTHAHTHAHTRTHTHCFCFFNFLILSHAFFFADGKLWSRCSSSSPHATPSNAHYSNNK